MTDQFSEPQPPRVELLPGAPGEAFVGCSFEDGTARFTLQVRDGAVEIGYELARKLADYLLEHAEPEDRYEGFEGWVVVAVGHRGRSCILDVSPRFGAGRFMLHESGLGDPEDEWGLRLPEDPGVYRGHVKAHATRSWEGENDLEFSVVGEWVSIYPWEGA